MESISSNKIRPASHADTGWYSNDSKILEVQLEDFLERVHIEEIQKPKFFVCPHAGYKYSGLTAAFVYKILRRINPKHIILLGPSHYTSFKGAKACIGFDQVATPLGPIKIEKRGIPANIATLDSQHDIQEHCLEMQFPFLKKVAPYTTVTPFLVGHFNHDDPSIKALIDYLKNTLTDPDTVLLISTDFCHFGKKSYNYAPEWMISSSDAEFKNHLYKCYCPAKNANLLSTLMSSQLSERIKGLDLEGFNCLKRSLIDFEAYLEKTGATICGQNPLRVVLMLIENASILNNGRWTLLNYEQSSRIQKSPLINPLIQSSVSYVAAVYELIDPLSNK